MIDFGLIIGFEWDEGNARKNLDKHFVSQAESEQLFFNAPLLLYADQKHSENEIRIHAFGRTDSDRLLHVTFTLRQSETKIRIISARNMSQKERRYYGH